MAIKDEERNISPDHANGLEGFETKEEIEVSEFEESIEIEGEECANGWATIIDFFPN